ncbi:hypothetical protein B0J12DRAFT_773717 [Macrophomina phaseolina]|uniref:DUF1996 domain-containing protein n=1 Tax=Macrophomina phaseolina TaxID=35725 RepID=A0ABQ8FSG0_9PEZI|nr:hypothetical protein B0J12DRAFT_773717 [Macrophomina phaseolina]
MASFTLVALSLCVFAGSCEAFWRMPCRTRTGLARIDPIISPGIVSEHAHAIHGGNNFSLNTTYPDLLASNCTSCAAVQDKSAYWTPSLMFVHADGTTEVLPQKGGMLVYYFLHGETVQPFPPYFSMVAGNSTRRSFTASQFDSLSQDSLSQRAIGFNCLNYSAPAEPSLARHYLPPKSFTDAQCLDGLRLELMFPSCWNGKPNATDHKSHLAYPDQVMDGNCPEDYPQHLPALLFETIWDTYAYKDLQGEFILSNKDTTGYGYHGDFMNGWQTDILQRAIVECTDMTGMIEKCSVFSLQPNEENPGCVFTPPDELAKEDCAGPRDGLCGDITA